MLRCIEKSLDVGEMNRYMFDAYSVTIVKMRSNKGLMLLINY